MPELSRFFGIVIRMFVEAGAQHHGSGGEAGVSRSPRAREGNLNISKHPVTRLAAEIEKLVGSIAMGQAPTSIVAAIRERELEIARLEVRIRTPRQQPNIERLRDALTQRAAEWKGILRTEPKVARLLLRRLIGPLVLYDESTRPDFIKADAVIKAGLLDALVHDMASLHGPYPFTVAGSVVRRAA